MDASGHAAESAVDACVREYRAFTDAVALDKELRKARVALGEARGQLDRAKVALAKARTAKNKLADAGLRALRAVGRADPYLREGVRMVQGGRRGLRTAGRFAVLPLRVSRGRKRRQWGRRREKAEKMENALSPAERAFIRASNACPGKDEVARLHKALEDATDRHARLQTLLKIRQRKGLPSSRLLGETLRNRVVSLSGAELTSVAKALGGRGGEGRLIAAGRRISRLLPLEPASRAGLEATLQAAGTLNSMTRSSVGSRGREREHGGP